MADREKNIEILRQEIEELEKDIEQKKLLREPRMVPSPRGPVEDFGPIELVKEIEEMEKEVEGKKNLLLAFESNLFGKHESIPKFDKEARLRPGYRQGGYFTSQDYYDKCDEFHRMLEEQGKDIMSLRRDEYIFLKKKFFQDMYGITWLAEEYQYLPGTVSDVHISHPNNYR